MDACRAGDVYRWVKYHEEKRVTEAMYGWQNLLGSVGLAVLKCRLEEDRLSGRAVQSALERVNRGPDLDGLRTDVLRHLFSYRTLRR